MIEPLDYWLKQGIKPSVAFLLSDGAIGFAAIHRRVKDYESFRGVTIIEPDGSIKHYFEYNIPGAKVTKIVPFDYRPESLLEDLMALKAGGKRNEV
jgi:hypothetical protein